MRPIRHLLNRVKQPLFENLIPIFYPLFSVIKLGKRAITLPHRRRLNFFFPTPRTPTHHHARGKDSPMMTNDSNRPNPHDHIAQITPTMAELYRVAKKLGIPGRRLLERICARLHQLDYMKHGTPVHITVSDYAATYDISLDTAMAEIREGIAALHRPGKLRKTQKQDGDGTPARYCELWFSWVDSIQLDSALLNQGTIFKKEAKENLSKPKGDATVSVWISKNVHANKSALLKKIKNDFKIKEPAPLSFKEGVKSVGMYAETLRKICDVQGSDFWSRNKIRTKDISIVELHKKMQSCHSYQTNFKDFRRNVLTPAIQLLNDKREHYRATLSMEPIKTGKKVTSIRFTVTDVEIKPRTSKMGSADNDWNYKEPNLE